MKILVVDDKPMNLRSARKTLPGHDVTYCIAFDTAVANFLSEERNENYDVVLTDLMMPLGGEYVHDGINHIYLEQQIPLGFIVALKALSRGVKFIAIVTDLNHHTREIIAEGLVYSHLKEIKIDGGKMMICDAELLRNKDDLVNLPCPVCRENPGLCWRCFGPQSHNQEMDPDSCEWSCENCEKTKGVCFKCKGTGFAPQPAMKDWGKALAKLIA